MDAKPSRLLEQLRQQSDAVRKNAGDDNRPVEDTLRAMDRQLWTSFRWLEEVLRHFEVIRPRVQHTFKLLGLLSIASPRYERGFISYRRRPVAGMDLLDSVELFYRLTNETPIVFKVQPGVASSVEDRLRSANLQFRYDTELDEHRSPKAGVFTVSPEITASVRFEPDYRRQRYEVTLRNIDRFEPLVLDVGGDALTESALEDFVRLLLGEGNQFLRRATLAGLGGKRVDSGTTASTAKGSRAPSRSLA